jgi:hypothetical protein
MANTRTVRKVLKYGTGQPVPEGAVYLCTIKNGKMTTHTDMEYVWHYFLVEVRE